VTPVEQEVNRASHWAKSTICIHYFRLNDVSYHLESASETLRLLPDYASGLALFYFAEVFQGKKACVFLSASQDGAIGRKKERYAILKSCNQVNVNDDGR
jgi:hypothetical protein